MKSTRTTINSPWLSVENAAEYLQLAESTIQRYRRSGLLPYYKATPTSTQFRYKIADLDKLMESSRRVRKS